MSDAIIEQVRHLARKFAKSSEMLAVEGEHRFAGGASYAAQTLDACIVEIERLRADLARVTAERDELAAIVERLPKTADGVPAVPLLTAVYHPKELDHLGQPAPLYIHNGNLGWANRGPNTGAPYWRVCDCYSTREAAKAAREGK